MKHWRIVGGVKWVAVVVPVGPLSLAKEDSVHQFKALSLVIVKWKLEQRYGIINVDNEVADEDNDHQRHQHIGKGGPGKA
jgi:hypothetical protein